MFSFGQPNAPPQDFTLQSTTLATDFETMAQLIKDNDRLEKEKQKLEKDIVQLNADVGDRNTLARIVNEEAGGTRSAIVALNEAEMKKHAYRLDLEELSEAYRALRREFAAYRTGVENAGLEQKLADMTKERDAALQGAINNSDITKSLSNVTHELENVTHDLHDVSEQLQTVTKERDAALQGVIDHSDITQNLSNVTQELGNVTHDLHDVSEQLRTVTKERDELLQRPPVVQTVIQTVERPKNLKKDLLYSLIIMFLAFLAFVFFLSNNWNTQPGAFGYGGPPVDNAFTRLHARIAEAAYDWSGPFEIYM